MAGSCRQTQQKGVQARETICRELARQKSGAVARRKVRQCPRSQRVSACTALEPLLQSPSYTSSSPSDMVHPDSVQSPVDPQRRRYRLADTTDRRRCCRRAPHVLRQQPCRCLSLHQRRSPLGPVTAASAPAPATCWPRAPNCLRLPPPQDSPKDGASHPHQKNGHRIYKAPDARPCCTELPAMQLDVVPSRASRPWTTATGRRAPSHVRAQQADRI